jgi:F-box protein 9
LPAPNSATNSSLTDLPKSVSRLIADFSTLSIPPEEPPTEFSPAPPCPISQIPDEVLVEILHQLADSDVASFSRLSLVCKRLAYLVATEDQIWRRIVTHPHQGLAGMKYDFSCTVEWNEIVDSELGGFSSELSSELEGSIRKEEPPVPPLLLPPPLTPSYPTYRQMFRSRPRIRFNGCYISTVNYTRPGAVAANSLTWNTEILIVTYYRYLRFFPDGSLITLLTTSEPSDVVPYLHKEHMHYQHQQQGGNLPQSVMKNSLRGRWRLSGDAFGIKAQRNLKRGLDPEAAEPEGDIHVETEGVISKYRYVMQLRFGNAGKVTKNNKLHWVGYWSHNRLTDEVSDFGLQNDRAYPGYFWSRVKSWV